MSDNTEFTKLPANESRIGTVSTRGLITLLVVLTVCGMSACGIEVKEPLYTLVGMCIGYYFGQKNKPNQPQ